MDTGLDVNILTSDDGYVGQLSQDHWQCERMGEKIVYDNTKCPVPEGLLRETCAHEAIVIGHVIMMNKEKLANASGRPMHVKIYDSGYDQRTVYLDGLYDDDFIYMMNR